MQSKSQRHDAGAQLLHKVVDLQVHARQEAAHRDPLVLLLLLIGAVLLMR